MIEREKLEEIEERKEKIAQLENHIKKIDRELAGSNNIGSRLARQKAVAELEHLKASINYFLSE